ncbi:hypothetical protein MOV98_09105 [Acinetobacter variabilis]|nr:hypothetical protein MOV98_09105 [Acinetobacter variabilis]
MPLPTAAELTDPNATNTQMKQRLGQLAENVASTEFVNEKNTFVIKALNSEALTDVGSIVVPDSTQYSKTGLITVAGAQLLKITSQAYGSNEVYAFYDFFKRKLMFLCQHKVLMVFLLLTWKSQKMPVMHK